MSQQWVHTGPDPISMSQQWVHTGPDPISMSQQWVHTGPDPISMSQQWVHTGLDLISIRVFPGSKWVFGAQKKNCALRAHSLCYHVTLLAYMLPFHKSWMICFMRSFY